MVVKEKLFPCLSCGADTGCPNKLTCDRCRTHRKREATLVRVQKKPAGHPSLDMEGDSESFTAVDEFPGIKDVY